VFLWCYITIVPYYWNQNVSTNFSKKANIKFHENLSTASKTVPSGQMDKKTQKQQKLLSVTVLQKCLKKSWKQQNK
jgi:hypothetical protein